MANPYRPNPWLEGRNSRYWVEDADNLIRPQVAGFVYTPNGRTMEMGGRKEISKWGAKPNEANETGMPKYFGLQRKGVFRPPI